MARKPSTANIQKLTRKQTSRAKREARLQRWIIIGAVALAVATIGVIVYGFIDQQYLKPNRALISVNDQKVTASQFQDQVKVNHYTQFGGVIPLAYYGLDANSYSKLVLDSMTDDLIIEIKAKEMGITVTDEEIQSQLELAFGYDAGDPEPTATATATNIPIVGSPTVTSTFVYTPSPTPTETLAPGATPTLTPTQTPTLAGTATPTVMPTITVTPSPAPTATPLTEAGFKQSMADALKQANQATGLSEAEIKAVYVARVKANILRRKLMNAVDISPDKTKTLIHAAHILVENEDDAKKALEKIKEGDSFEKVAADLSIAKTDAYKGGDLGWFTPGQGTNPYGDTELEQAALKVAAGQISDPVKTLFGWSLIKVYENKTVPTTADEQEQQRLEKFDTLLKQWRAELKPVIDDLWVEFVPAIQ